MACLCESHYDVSYRGSNICSHDHRDCCLDRGTCRHQAHDDGGGCGGGLDKDGDQHPYHQAYYWVLQKLRIREQRTNVPPSKNTERVREEGERTDEEEKASKERDQLCYSHCYLLQHAWIHQK